jgi:hypothetical protein
MKAEMTSRGNAKALYLPSYHAHVTLPARCGCKTKSNATNAAQWYWNEDIIDNKTNIENNSQRALNGLPSKQAVANTDSTEATALCQ